MASQDATSMVQGSGADASPRQEVIIHRTVRDVGGANWPVLTRTNYDEWAMLMKVKLRVRKLWRAIEEGTEDEEEDCAAMEAFFLTRTVHPSCKQSSQVVNKSWQQRSRTNNWYVAAATAACQAVWLRRLLGELTGEEARPPALMVDNQPAIALAKNPVLHDRSKHIDTRFHFIRDCVDEGQIVLEFVESGRQLADILTKPLGRLQFMELRTKIEMIGNKQEQQD